MKKAVEMWKLPEVERRTGKSKPMIYAGMREDTFPKSRKIGKRSVAWRSDEIQKWIDRKETA